MLEQAGFTHIQASTAHILKKESTITCQEVEFPVFLITAVKETISA
jgi:hypothetical protein